MTGHRQLAGDDRRRPGPSPNRGRLSFEVADLAHVGARPGPLDVVVSNATLQWVPGHLALLHRFVGWLAPGGCLAFQVPGNFRSPSHRLLAELRQRPRWAAAGGRGRRPPPRGRAIRPEYAAALARRPDPGCGWTPGRRPTCTCCHGPDPVLEWVQGHRPAAGAGRPREAGEREEFLAEYGALLREAYPSGPDGLHAVPLPPDLPGRPPPP